jgi:hypothetical protein
MTTYFNPELCNLAILIITFGTLNVIYFCYLYALNVDSVLYPSYGSFESWINTNTNENVVED